MRNGSASDRLLRATDLACDGTVGAFAIWTLCCHVAVFTGLGLDTLILIASLALGVAALGGVLVARAIGRRGRPGAPAPASDPGAPPVASSTPALGLRLAVVAVAAGCAAAASAGAPLAAVWSVALALVLGLSLRELGAARAPQTAALVTPGALAWLAALALLCVVATLCSHRPDADDGFYLDLAVAAADAPRAALLAGDTLHRVPGVPLALPVYRVHSLELLQAALARIGGLPVLDVAHLALPAFAALLLPFAYARLLRPLTPRAWPWALGVATGFLLFSATASHGWANFGIVRLHQGKAMLLSLALPLTVAYAIEFARAGGGVRFAKLAAVQIGAVGLSASGLWLAPAVAAPALLAGLPDRRSGPVVRRLFLGLLASAYVLGLAMALRGATAAAFRNAAVPSPELEMGSVQLATQALRAVLGPGLPGLLALFVTLGAWSFASNALARRLCAFSSLATLVLWNPLAAQSLAAWLTSAPTYWRVLWLLPLPALFAVVLTAPLEAAGGPLKRPVRAAAVVATAALVFGAGFWQAPRALTLSAANHVRLGAPGWKIPRAELAAVRSITTGASENDVVLAPRRVAPWIPAFHRHPTPLVVRIEYLPVLYEKLGPDELARRVQLLRLVSGERRVPRADDLLRSAISQDGISIVCLAAAARRWPDVSAVLVDSGFQKIHADADYEVWRRARDREAAREATAPSSRPRDPGTRARSAE